MRKHKRNATRNTQHACVALVSILVSSVLGCGTSAGQQTEQEQSPSANTAEPHGTVGTEVAPAPLTARAGEEDAEFSLGEIDLALPVRPASEVRFPFQMDGVTVCSMEQYVEQGTTLSRFEFYLLDRLEAERSTGPFRATLAAEGIDRIDDCQSARRFSDLKRSDEPDVPPETVEPAGGTPATPAAPTPQLEDKVMDGYNYLLAESVRIWTWHLSGAYVGTCTAALIGPYTMMTAAHCLVSPGYKTFQVFYRNAAEAACLTVPGSQSQGTCSQYPGGTNSLNTGFAWIHPDYTGTGDDHNDVAIVSMLTPWRSPADNSGSWVRITGYFVNPGDSVWLHGWGANAYSPGGAGAGVARLSNTPVGVDWIPNNYKYFLAYAQAGEGRPCYGDSGGSAIVTGWIPYDLSVGISSTFSTVYADNCPHPGEKFRYTQLAAKAVWIASTLGCTQFIYSGILYYRCW